MYLVDTNVISEARKGAKADAGVIAFWRNAASSDLYLAVQTIGEIRSGFERILRRGDTVQAKRLGNWLQLVVSEYADRILAFDVECAQVWGGLMSGDAQNAIDKQIAAIALIHDLTVVTRNVGDFENTGVRILNPFSGKPSH